MTVAFRSFGYTTFLSHEILAYDIFVKAKKAKRHFCHMLNPISLHGKAGDRLSRVGYALVNGVLVSSNPYHLPGEGHPRIPEGVPTYGLMQELARFVVSEPKSRSYILKAVKSCIEGFPDSKRVITRKVSRPISAKWGGPAKLSMTEEYRAFWRKAHRATIRLERSIPAK